MYCMLPDAGASDLAMETLRQRWQCMNDNRRGRRSPEIVLAKTVRWAHLPKLLLVGLANDALNVLEEWLQQGSSVFDERTNRGETVVPINRMPCSEDDTSLRPGLHAIKDDLIPQSFQQLFHDEITLSILSSVCRGYLFPKASFNWTTVISYQYVPVEKASRVPDADGFPLFNNIAYKSHTNKQRWPRILFIGYQYQLPRNTYTQRPRCY